MDHDERTGWPDEPPRAARDGPADDGRRRQSRDESPARASDTPLPDGQHFTARGLLVGLAVGLVICFSNMYFGLQTGWVSTMTMPASLLGFGVFRAVSPHLSLPFSPVENVLVQTVAGSMAIMPLGCGFVGVVPAMHYLLTKEEQGPIAPSTWKLVLWSLGLCYFGVVFAVPLRRQVIIREQLRFPSGFSTAVLISVLHGRAHDASEGSSPDSHAFASLAQAKKAVDRRFHVGEVSVNDGPDALAPPPDKSWRTRVRLLAVCFVLSGAFTLLTYFLPVLRNVPIFGPTAARWLWTLNPSPAYVGQGVIMGPATTLHMLAGAILAWAVLSPLAKHRGWAPGHVDDWETGSKGWILWASLAIMLADAIVSLAHLSLRPLWSRLARLLAPFYHVYAPLSDRPSHDSRAVPLAFETRGLESDADEGDVSRSRHLDAPPGHLVSTRTVVLGLSLSVVFCIACIHVVFGELVPLGATVAAVIMALLLSIMGVRALGETDLNPVSGISKLAQLFFALIIPQSNPSSVLINLVAGAVSEAGALQAAELMQDLKTGHLLGASPKAQFYGQIIGASVGAVASALIYRMYTSVYDIPGSLFQVPTSYVWIFTARLVTGKGLPPMAKEWAISLAVIFSVLTALRIYADTRWQAVIPGGIAVAVGMYNVPSFTLARVFGGLLGWWWKSAMGWQGSPLIVLASGLILGEGFLSIVNLMMQSLGVQHL